METVINEESHKHKVAVVLSGSGVYDGSEVNEVVLSLLHLEHQNIKYEVFAPDKEQYHVIDHISGGTLSGSRNVLIESARIVRGKISPLGSLNVCHFDGLIVPGGFGVAKNLSSFAFDNENFKIDEAFYRIMIAFKAESKPTAYMCIAPVLLPKVYDGIYCTIGRHTDTSRIINLLGGEHIDCNVEDVVVDCRHKVVTTPAFMLSDNLGDVSEGIKKLVREFKKLLQSK